MDISEVMKKRGINSDCTILQTLKIMDERHVKMLLIFSGNDFVGILTIGDIQRAIIKKPDLMQPIMSIIDPNKDYASPEDAPEVIRKKMVSLRAECMPVVSKDGKLIDIYEWQDMISCEPPAVRRGDIDIPVIIMAGGKGVRLKPLTNVIPKPLIPLGEKTIIEVILQQFHDIGCRNFYISVNYKADMLKYYIDSLPQHYNIEYFQEDVPMGTIGSISLLNRKFSSPFFVSNCDIVIDQDFREVYDYHVSNANDITIVAAVKDYSIPYGVIEVGKDGIVSGLREKPTNAFMVNTGVYILNADMVDKIPPNTKFNITDLIEEVIAAGGRVGSFPVSANAWTDIGDMPEYIKFLGR